MTLTEWKLVDILRQAKEQQPCSKPKACRSLGKAPRNIHKRTTGESVLFDGLEWIYAPHGIARETWDYLYDLASRKAGRIQVIRWPEGDIAFDSAVK